MAPNRQPNNPGQVTLGPPKLVINENIFRSAFLPEKAYLSFSIAYPSLSRPLRIAHTPVHPYPMTPRPKAAIQNDPERPLADHNPSGFQGCQPSRRPLGLISRCHRCFCCWLCNIMQLYSCIMLYPGMPQCPILVATYWESCSFPCRFPKKKATAFKMMNLAEITCAKVRHICAKVADISGMDGQNRQLFTYGKLP